jgi:hypothetical protein
MKPGDLVQIISTTLDWPPVHRGSRIGMIIGFDERISDRTIKIYPIQVLIDGKIVNFNDRELRPLSQNDEGPDETR